MRFRNLIVLTFVVLWAACAGAATYYCDLAADYTDATGVDHAGNQYTGVGGLQAAIRGTGNATALAAGDTLYLKCATGNLGRLVVMDCGADVSATGLGWALGDEVRNKDGAGDDWTGVICQLSVGADVQTILVELDAAYTSAVVADADGIENTTQSESCDPLDSHSCPGIQVDTASGDLVSGSINFVGCAADWSTGNGDTDYCATLDAQSVATNVIKCDGSNSDYLWFENLILANATAANFDTNASNMSACRFRFVVSDNAGTNAWNALYVKYSVWEHCIASGATLRGFYQADQSRLVSCVATGNGYDGFSLNNYCAVVGCVAEGNGDDGIETNGPAHTIAGCIIDGNTDDGIILGAADYTEIVHCRITNNGNYGIRQEDAADGAIGEDYNVFYLNATAHRLNIVAGANSRTAANAAECGYIDQAGGDFTLTAAAIMAGTDAAALVLDWTTTPANTGYYTAGIPRRTSAGGAILKTGGKQ